MDPWLSGFDRDTPHGGSQSQSFEDSFLPYAGQQPSELTKLPDSQEYLERLEKKLEKLQGRTSLSSERGGNSSERARLLAGLSLARESVVADLLGSDAESEVRDLERAVETNLVVRRLLPQQPVNREEVLELVREDTLQRGEEELQEQEQGAQGEGTQ